MRGTPAAPIATPSSGYGKKVANRDYETEKSSREEARQAEAEERQKQREMGESVDLGKAGDQWNANAKPVIAAKRRPRKKNQPDELDAWWAEDTKGKAPTTYFSMDDEQKPGKAGNTVAAVPATEKKKKKKASGKPKTQKPENGGSNGWKSGSGQDWKLWGSKEPEDAQGKDWKLWGSKKPEDFQDQDWKNWGAKESQATGKAKSTASKAMPKAASSKAKPASKPKAASKKVEKVDVWDAWNVPKPDSENPENDGDAREITLSGYLGPEMNSAEKPPVVEDVPHATTASEQNLDGHTVDMQNISTPLVQDEKARLEAELEKVRESKNKAVAEEDYAKAQELKQTEQELLAALEALQVPDDGDEEEDEQSSLINRLVQFLQHRDKGDDASREKAREFLRTVARQQKEVGAFGILTLENVELAIGSWERHLWCMKWLREKGKDDLAKAAAVLMHAAKRGIEFPEVGALLVGEVERAIEEFEAEEESEDSEEGGDADDVPATPASAAEGTEQADFTPPSRIQHFQ